MHIAATGTDGRRFLTMLKVHAPRSIPALMAATDPDARTPLLAAVSDGTVEMVEALARLAAEHGQLSAADVDGNTALHLALWPEVQAAVLETLLQARAPLNARNRLGKTPLLLALEVQAEDAAARLLAHGADVKIPDVQGSTALHVAAAAGMDAIAADLQTAGASALVTDADGQRPTDVARLSGHAALSFRLDPQRLVCGHCQRMLQGQLNTCSGCYARSYCSNDCQVRWEGKEGGKWGQRKREGEMHGERDRE